MFCGQISNISNVLGLLNGQECQQFVVFMVMREKGKMRKVCYVGMARAGQGTMSV